MQDYIETLKKINSVALTPKERLLKKRIELYIRKQIEPNDILITTSLKEIEFTVFCLNKILNEEKEKYLIKLPTKQFPDLYIYHAQTKRIGLFNTYYEINLHNNNIHSRNINDTNYAEIIGNLNFPTGTPINLEEYLTIMAQTLNFPPAQFEPINFKDIDYLTKDQLASIKLKDRNLALVNDINFYEGNLPTFEELVQKREIIRKKDWNCLNIWYNT